MELDPGQAVFFCNPVRCRSKKPSKIRKWSFFLSVLLRNLIISVVSCCISTSYYYFTPIINCARFLSKKREICKMMIKKDYHPPLIARIQIQGDQSALYKNKINTLFKLWETRILCITTSTLQLFFRQLIFFSDLLRFFF